MIGRHLTRLSRFVRWRYLRWAVVVPVLPLLLWACNSHPLEAPDPRPEQQTNQYYEVNPIRDVDILFMVDNSPSMNQEQENLGRNFPAFMDELKKIPGGLPNVHIGVISSDMGAGPTPVGSCTRPGGDRGIFQVKPNCGLNPNERFLISRENGSFNNFAGDIGRVFSCMALLGVTGCGFEHQLQATRVALYESITPENKGFLRPNAYLAVILITDEDDCSAEPNSDLFTQDYGMSTASFRCAREGHLCNGRQPPTDAFQSPLAECKANPGGKLIAVQQIVDSIRMLKARPDQQIIVAGIFGWPNNPTGALYRYTKSTRSGEVDYAAVCESANGQATAALRVKEFVEAFGQSGNYFSICQDDFRPAMKAIGEKVAARLSTPCIGGQLMDMDLQKPGVQADCQVVDRVPMQGTATGYQDTPLPNCALNGNRPPCWDLAQDSMCEFGYKVSVNRGGMMAKQGTQQSIQCATCPVGSKDARCK